MEIQDRASAIWEVPECPLAIEYSLRICSEIRLAVTEAFFSLPRGGVEIGGILLGRRLPGRVTIEGFTPLDCEHAFGPSFTLSPNDEAKLEQVISEARRSPSTVPVGWYHSHTRSEVFFSATDIDVHRRFFPEPWQVALVVRPRTLGPTDAGFFFTEADGSIHGESSYGGFTLENPPAHHTPTGKPDDAPRPPEPAPVAPEIEIAAVPESSADLGATLDSLPPSIGLELSRVSEPKPRMPPPPADRVLPPAVRKLLPERDSAGPRELSVPNFAVEHPRSRAWIASIAITAGLAAGAAGYQTRDQWLPRIQNMAGKTSSQAAPTAAQAPAAARTVNFNAVDSGGQLLLQWDRSSNLVLNSTGALLVISDGTIPPQAVGLDVAHVKTGSFTYARQTGHVDLALTLHLPDGGEFKELATFLGSDPVPASPASAGDGRERDLADQTAKLQARNKKLEKTVEDLRRDLRREQRRRLDAIRE